MSWTYVPPTNPHPRLLELTPEGARKMDVLAYINSGVVVDSNHYLAGRPDLITIRPLPEAATQAKIRPKGSVLHTQASGGQASNEAAWNFFFNYSSNESHIIGPEMDGIGRVLQCIPFNVRADSNYKGNQWWEKDGKKYDYAIAGGESRGLLSWETQDRGAATLNTTGWSLQQLDVISATLTAVHFVYRLPCTDTVSYRSGGISPHNRWPEWSKDNHSCPGDARTRQMDWIRGEVARRLSDIYTHCGEACPGMEA